MTSAKLEEARAAAMALDPEEQAALAADLLGRIRRVSPLVDPVAWIKARLLDTQETLSSLWRDQRIRSENDRNTIFGVWQITTATCVALARGDEKGFQAINGAAKKALQNSLDGELTVSEQKQERRPGAALINREYGGQGVLMYGDTPDIGRPRLYGLGFKRSATKVVIDAAKDGDAEILEFVNFPNGRGAAATEFVQHLQLLYCLDGPRFSFDEALAGRGWSLHDSDNWWTVDSRIVAGARAVHDAAIAAGDQSPFEANLSREAEFQHEFESVRSDLRKALTRWRAAVGCRSDGKPDGSDFETLVRSCFKALPGAKSGIVDSLFKARQVKDARERATRGGQERRRSGGTSNTR
jgi:hypothetical protein